MLGTHMLGTHAGFSAQHWGACPRGRGPRRSPGARLPPIRRGSGGPQKPFSWLSEGVRDRFTTDTENGEIACLLHLKITNVVLTSPEQFARENQQCVQRYRE